MMAEAYGKLTGRPGICFVTRGPGATNACARRTHCHAGFDADDPVHRPGRHAACANARRFRNSITRRYSERWRNGRSRSIEPDRIPELVARAFRIAMQGRPGPVVIALPEDMLTEMADVADAPRVEPVARARAGRHRCALAICLPVPTPDRDSSAAADGPTAADEFARFAERFELPVATSFRRADAVCRRPSALCRRSRHRSQSEADRAHQGAPTSSC